MRLTWTFYIYLFTVVAKQVWRDFFCCIAVVHTAILFIQYISLSIRFIMNLMSLFIIKCPVYTHAFMYMLIAHLCCMWRRLKISSIIFNQIHIIIIMRHLWLDWKNKKFFHRKSSSDIDSNSLSSLFDCKYLNERFYHLRKCVLESGSEMRVNWKLECQVIKQPQPLN